MISPRSSDVPALSCRNIAKTYESNHVTACRDISIDLHAGEIHCILGENGAGKSTLMRILTGDQRPDRGSVIIQGETASLSSPHDALKRGIGMIHQQSNCIAELTVWENIILGAEELPLVLPVTAQGRTRKAVDRICSTYGLSLPYRKIASKLDSSGIQTAALVSLLLRNVQVLIFDEPHTLFSGTPPPLFTDLAGTFAREGKAVAVVTHNLETAFSIASRITVLRRGASMGTFLPQEIDIKGASRLMMGLPPQFEAAPETRPHRRAPSRQSPVMTLDQVTTEGDPDNPSVLKDVSFSVHPGEILACVGIKEHGLTTLEGLITSFASGRGDPPRLAGGTVQFDGLSCGYPADLEDFRKAGGAYVPSDRLVTGTAVRCSVTDNAMLHVHKNLTGSIPGIIARDKALSYARKLIKDVSIHARPEDVMLSLSGGNIQKLIAARELALNPKLLIACEITWGLDIMTQ